MTAARQLRQAMRAPRSTLREEVGALLTTREVAELFRVDTKVVLRWKKAGWISAITTPLGGALRFKESEVLALLKGEGETK
jgi:excisionase family DNA binding protein